MITDTKLSGDDAHSSSSAILDHVDIPVIGRPGARGYGPSDNGDRNSPLAMPEGVSRGEPVARDVPGSAGALRSADPGAARASGDTVGGPAEPARPADAGQGYVIDDVLDDEPASSPLPTETVQAFGLSAAEAEELLVYATGYLARNASGRKARYSTPPSEKTEVLYRKKMRNMVEALAGRGDHTGNLAMDLLVPYSRSRQTYKVMRAALKWHLVRRIEFRVSEQNHFLRQRSPLPLRSSLSLRRALQVVQQLDGLPIQDCLDYLQRDPIPERARRGTLLELKSEERARFLEAAAKSGIYRMADAVLNFCGVRPAELEQGVRLDWLNEQEIRVTIRGGKCRPSIAGQEWRRMQLRTSMLPEWFVNRVRDSKTLKVSVKPDPLRRHLERLAPVVLNPKRRSKQLSAYAFRHALVTDLRDSGWTSEEIAIVIGEQSAATVATYGLLRRGTGKVRPRVAVLRASICAASPVKPADRSGLATVRQRAASVARKVKKPQS